jgi:predicted tellurium resistance membrane protein TerC
LLVFIGAKMIGHGHVHIPNWASLTIIAGFIGTGVIASLVANRRKAAATDSSDSPAEPPAS